MRLSVFILLAPQEMMWERAEEGGYVDFKVASWGCQNRAAQGTYIFTVLLSQSNSEQWLSVKKHYAERFLCLFFGTA